MNPVFTGPLAGQAVNANRSYISTVYINELSDNLTYVFQNDNGWQFGLQDGMYTPVASQKNNGLAQWYGLVNYLFYKTSDTTTWGMRFEYFRDNNGFRVFNPLDPFEPDHRSPPLHPQLRDRHRLRNPFALNRQPAAGREALIDEVGLRVDEHVTSKPVRPCHTPNEDQIVPARGLIHATSASGGLATPGA